MASISCDSGISPPHAQSSPFSISDILSKDIGQKKSPVSGRAVPFSTPNGISNPSGHSMFNQKSANQVSSAGIDTPKRPRKTSVSHFVPERNFVPERYPKISLSEAGTVASSLGYAGHRDSQVVSGPQMLTPHKPSSMNSSIVSPFNANLLLAMGHRPSPSREEKEELFGEGSLGVLSEVAHYHGELSGTEANNSSLDMREKFANIKLVTSTDGPHNASKGGMGDASLVSRYRKASTPGILKRDKRRKRVLSAPYFSSVDESSVLKHSQATTVDSGFLSPHASEKSSSSKELTFSPSIFLSHPDHTHSMMSSDHASSSALSLAPKIEGVATAVAPPSRLAARFSVSPGSESDRGHSVSSDTTDNDGGSFVTSTPIKCGKENQLRSSDSDEGWSPTILLNKRRRHLREPNETSSGSESQAVKRPCFRAPHRSRKSKARTKLSPLLENACSPISKDSILHPSPLAVTLGTTPTQDATAAAVVASRPQHLPMPLATISSCSVPAALPVSMPRPSPVAPPPPLGFLGSGGLLTAGVAQGTTPISGQNLLSPPAPSPMVLNHPFPAVSAFLPLSTAQFTTRPHQNMLLQQNPLGRLQPPFPYNPLVSVCNSSALQGYSIIPNTAGGIPPNYLPHLVGLMAPPPNHPASYLSYSNPYLSDAHLLAMSGSGNSSGQGSCQNMEDVSTRREAARHMGSVPPWFIFSNNRSEKRSRLTEAINKSLSELPSQSKRLPAEWTKYACGQTDDQKNLTEKARCFLQFRQLTTSEEMD